MLGVIGVSIASTAVLQFTIKNSSDLGLGYDKGGPRLGPAPRPHLVRAGTRPSTLCQYMGESVGNAGRGIVTRLPTRCR